MRKINDEYDIGKAFSAIEDELMASMIRNMRRHKAEETREGIQWAQWQTLQLKALEKYRTSNRKKFGNDFTEINRKITELIRKANVEGGMSQEKSILQAIKKGFKVSGRNSSGHPGATAEFFKLNERKLEALIQATQHDMQRAETAVLRMANDQYRKIIFNAQVYANTGAGTYEKAVDMATRDFLAAGINCIEYKNGARHTISDYADMAIRTASKRAYLQGEGQKRQEWGISTVIVNKRGNPCPKCLPFVGKVLIDDVWSGGSRKDGPYPLMSTVIAAGLYHPRCKDSHTTYFKGISTADDTWTQEELEAIGWDNKIDAEQQYAERQVQKFTRLATYSLDAENRNEYLEKERLWKERSNKGIIRETVMNRSVVESAEYRRKLEKLTEDDSIKRSIAQEMLSAIRHRSGSKFEDLVFVDSATGKVRRSVDFAKESTASPTKAMRKMLKDTKEGTIIAIHNHPGSSVPSWSDIAVAAGRKYKYGLIACHDGKIFKYQITGEPVKPFYVSAVAKLDKTGYNKESLKEFCEAVKDAGIEMEVL